MSEEFKSDEFETPFGKLIVTKDTIALKRSGEYSKWSSVDWIPAWWSLFGLPEAVHDRVLEKAKGFVKVANEMILRDVHYLGHPVITAWINYNQNFIVFMRSLGMRFSDERILQAVDHLKTVGGIATVNAAKRAVKRRDKIALERVNELKQMVKPLHDVWWKFRKLNNPAERKRRILTNPYEGVKIPYEAGPLHHEVELDEWVLPWLDIFEDPRCSEKKRQKFHLQQAVSLFMRKHFRKVNLSNLSRGARQITR